MNVIVCCLLKIGGGISLGTLGAVALQGHKRGTTKKKKEEREKRGKEKERKRIEGGAEKRGKIDRKIIEHNERLPFKWGIQRRNFRGAKLTVGGRHSPTLLQGAKINDQLGPPGRRPPDSIT